MFRASTALHRSAGLVGLPNVGKSTLFNALVRAQLAAASNFPFTTIKRAFALSWLAALFATRQALQGSHTHTLPHPSDLILTRSQHCRCPGAGCQAGGAGKAHWQPAHHALVH